ncbi:hypothetical protein Hdeb2414_s0006g00196311 [Helianthus debilis subsp. tardiflorus]
MSKKVITAVSMREFSISLPGDYLQHENTKTKYIRFYRKTPMYCVLWRNVTAANSGIMSYKISSKAKVGYFWIHITIQQNIRCLEISVDNLKARILM